MILRLKFITKLLISLVLLTSCEKGDPIIPNEEEVITSLIYTLAPIEGGNNVILKFQDIDGDGGLSPSVTSDALSSNTIYQGTLVLLNEQFVPPESITDEVAEESDEHQIFYMASANIDITYQDQDDNGFPLGLLTKLVTGPQGPQNITIILRHEPDKGASGVAQGDISNAGGETDIEVNFEVDVL